MLSESTNKTPKIRMQMKINFFLSPDHCRYVFRSKLKLRKQIIFLSKETEQGLDSRTALSMMYHCLEGMGRDPRNLVPRLSHGNPAERIKSSRTKHHKLKVQLNFQSQQKEIKTKKILLFHFIFILFSFYYFFS